MTRGLLTCLFWTVIAVCWVVTSLLSLAFDAVWVVASAWFNTFGFWQTFVLIPILTGTFILGCLICYFCNNFLRRAAWLVISATTRVWIAFARLVLAML